MYSIADTENYPSALINEKFPDMEDFNSWVKININILNKLYIKELSLKIEQIDEERAHALWLDFKAFYYGISCRGCDCIPLLRVFEIYKDRLINSINIKGFIPDIRYVADVEEVENLEKLLYSKYTEIRKSKIDKSVEYKNKCSPAILDKDNRLILENLKERMENIATRGYDTNAANLKISEKEKDALSLILEDYLPGLFYTIGNSWTLNLISLAQAVQEVNSKSLDCYSQFLSERKQFLSELWDSFLFIEGRV